MMTDLPTRNLPTFLITLVLMGVLLFQFGWFREQFCTVMCPYARFQSVLMDPDSLLVGYDAHRGEPRGKFEHRDGPRQFGDCIDCGLCVRVCPTGIDIRNGTQLECIHCAACIDACNTVMAKIGRPLGLIRYDTENRLARKNSNILRPRVIIYFAFLIVYIASFSYFISTRQLSEYQILRVAQDAAFTILPDGRIGNQLSIHLSNKGGSDEVYTLELLGSEGIELITPLRAFPVPAGELRNVPVFVNFDRKLLQNGSLNVTFKIISNSGYNKTAPFVLIGPQ
jgi:cytochrome c oxidase accessory protein FixG